MILTLPQAARALGFSESHLRRLCAAQKVNAWRKGRGDWRINVEGARTRAYMESERRPGRKRAS